MQLKNEVMSYLKKEFALLNLYLMYIHNLDI